MASQDFIIFPIAWWFGEKNVCERKKADGGSFDKYSKTLIFKSSCRTVYWHIHVYIHTYAAAYICMGSGVPRRTGWGFNPRRSFRTNNFFFLRTHYRARSLNGSTGVYDSRYAAGIFSREDSPSKWTLGLRVYGNKPTKHYNSICRGRQECVKNRVLPCYCDAHHSLGTRVIEIINSFDLNENWPCRIYVCTRVRAKGTGVRRPSPSVRRRVTTEKNCIPTPHATGA